MNMFGNVLLTICLILEASQTLAIVVNNEATTVYPATTLEPTFGITWNDCPQIYDAVTEPYLAYALVRFTYPTAHDVFTNLYQEADGNFQSGDRFYIGVTNVTFNATDSIGDSYECNILINVTDNEPPTFVGCVDNITEITGPDIMYLYVTWNIQAQDNSDVVEIMQTHSHGFYRVGETSVNITAVDSSGNEALCAFTVYIMPDDEPPMFTYCPDSINTTADPGSMFSVVSWSPAEAFDRLFDVTLNSDQNPNTTFPIGTTTVTYTAEDAYVNVATCVFNVTVADIEPPTITGCPENNITEIHPPGIKSGFVSWLVTAEDNSGSVDVDSSQTPGFFVEGEHTDVIINAVDSSGNKATCVFSIIVLSDDMPPDFETCPHDITQATDAGMPTATVDWDEPTISDSLSLAMLTAEYTPNDTFPIGTTVVQYTANDVYGNTNMSCVFNVTVYDDEPPTLTGCPAGNLSYFMSPELNAIFAHWRVEASDNSGEFTEYRSLVPNFYPEGIYQVVIVVNDESFSTNCSFYVNVIRDSIPPVFDECPDNIYQLIDEGTTSANVAFPPINATDDYDDVVIIFTYEPIEKVGGNFPLGETAVSFTAMDEAYNEAYCVFNVTIYDDIAPNATNCSDVFVVIPIGYEEVNVTWSDPIWTDNSGIVTSINYTHSSGVLIGESNFTVEVTATDGSSNEGVCQFTVTVITDIVPPTFDTCPSFIFTATDEGLSTAYVTWDVPLATDNIDGVEVWESHMPNQNFSIGTTQVMYVATDVAGNKDRCVFNVTVFDTYPPIIANCTTNVTYYVLRLTVDVNVTFNEPTAIDNSTIIINATKRSGDLFPVGATMVTFEFYDEFNTTDFCNFAVHVIEDTTAPIFTNCPGEITMNVKPRHSFVKVPWNWNFIATDNSGRLFYSRTHEKGDKLLLGNTTVSITAYDYFENNATCTFQVHVLPEITSECGEECILELEVCINDTCMPNTDAPRNVCSEYTMPVTEKGNCSSLWTLYGGYCYRLFDEKTSWSNAESQCKNYSSVSGEIGHLASIHSASEMLFLYTLITDLRAVVPKKTWIGLSDKDTLNEFNWTDSDLVCWSDVYIPADTMEQKCIDVNWWRDGVWEISGCDRERPYLCKLESW